MPSISRTAALVLAFALTALSAVPNYSNQPMSSDIPATGMLPNQYQLANCTAHYTVNEADTCLQIVDMHPNTLSLNQLYLWNPQIQRDCSNLAVGQTVCIRARTQQDCVACRV
ncbi:hypothetical protein PENDEC_c003G05348 [Penicillium decumbens]|uniref:LysM domain-containing protein n=1 Tax=Penicillium decumbens TaxID=69771 RepID=A0A1V6PKA6_PENDC|nr:hypothetical protein PENDEC_c003G05348 [Penicillium decumbens]